MHRVLLADDAFRELVFHPQELFLFALEHSVDRHAGPARDDLRHVIGGNGFLDHGALGFGCLDRLQFFLQLRNLSIGQFAGALEFAAALRIGKLGTQLVEFGLEFLCVGKLFLFRFPAAGQIGRTFFKDP